MGRKNKYLGLFLNGSRENERKKIDEVNVHIKQIGVKGIQEFFVLFLQHFILKSKCPLS